MISSRNGELPSRRRPRRLLGLRGVVSPVGRFNPCLWNVSPRDSSERSLCRLAAIDPHPSRSTDWATDRGRRTSVCGPNALARADRKLESVGAIGANSGANWSYDGIISSTNTKSQAEAHGKETRSKTIPCGGTTAT